MDADRVEGYGVIVADRRCSHPPRVVSCSYAATGRAGIGSSADWLACLCGEDCTRIEGRKHFVADPVVVDAAEKNEFPGLPRR